MSCQLLLESEFYYCKKGNVSNILFLHPIAILLIVHYFCILVFPILKSLISAQIRYAIPMNKLITLKADKLLSTHRSLV